jgi:putative CocE/NonD family hydrolase
VISSLRSAVARAVLRATGEPPPAVRDVVVTRGIRIPMDDGCELFADMWCPADDADAPLLLVRCPYGRGQLFGLQHGRRYAHQGFRVLLQSCRGTHGSGGSFVPFEHEQADGQATVEWVRAQPWFTGRFATVGGSYMGFVQLALAMDPPPELAAMVLQCTPSRSSRAIYPDGVLAALSILLWALVVQGTKRATLRAMTIAATGRSGLLRTASPPQLVEEYPRITGSRLPFVDGWLAHPDSTDSWWLTGDPSAALERITVPVLVQGGWYDPFALDSVEQFTALRCRGIDVQLTMGPDTHASFGRAASLGAEAVTWLRRVFEGAPPPRDPVRVQVLGTDEWTSLPCWPPPAAQQVLYLDDDSLLTAARSPSVRTFRFDPLEPTPTVGGPVLQAGAGPKDNRKLESRPDLLTYTSEPFADGLTIAGRPQVRLWVGWDVGGGDVFVRVCDVHPDGRSVNLVDRIVRLHPADLDVDGRWAIAVTLPPLAAHLAAGHRVRLQVSGGAFPRFALNPVIRTPATCSVHAGGRTPSQLLLPIPPIELLRPKVIDSAGRREEGAAKRG